MTKTDIIKKLIPMLLLNPSRVLGLFTTSALRRALIISERQNDKTGLDFKEFVQIQSEKHAVSNSYFYKIFKRAVR